VVEKTVARTLEWMIRRRVQIQLGTSGPVMPEHRHRFIRYLNRELFWVIRYNQLIAQMRLARPRGRTRGSVIPSAPHYAVELRSIVIYKERRICRLNRVGFWSSD
jgi:hypothetical protein